MSEAGRANIEVSLTALRGLEGQKVKFNGSGDEGKTKVTVEINGEEYVVKGYASPEYVKMLAEYVDKKMRQIGQKHPRLSASKVAVLAALNIADELSKLQEDYDTLVGRAEEEKGRK